MSHRDWRSYLAVGGVALLAAVADAQPISDNTGRQSAGSEAQSKPQDQGKPHPPGAVQDGIARTARADKTNERKTDAQKEDERGRRDLLAQERMAKWAMAVFWAAASQALLTLVGIFLIWRTLVHTRRAAEAARDMVKEGERATTAAVEATKEAKRSADIQETTFKRLERPYLFVQIVRMDGLSCPAADQQPYLIYTLVNHGKTPAILRAISIELVPMNGLTFRKGKVRVPKHLRQESYDVVAPGGGKLAEGRRVFVRDTHPGYIWASI